MSRPSLLISEPPLQVLPSLAKAIGLNEAIVLQQIQYWIALEQGIEKEGRRWIYNSVEEWRKQFPFWSTDTIQRTLQSLRDKGLVDAQKLSSDKWKHTLYYSINYNSLQDCITATCGKGLRESAESITADCNDGITAECDTPLPQLAVIIPTENTQRVPTETNAENTSFVAQSAPTAEDAPAPVEKTNPTPAKRGTRLPDSWTPSQELIAWAKEKAPGVDVLTATDNFVDYWHSASGAKASKCDWPAAWRVWIRNEGQRSPQRRAATNTNAGGVYRTPAQQAAHERGMSTASFFMDLEKELESVGALTPESRGR
jgi:hypothetical protein